MQYLCEHLLNRTEPNQSNAIAGWMTLLKQRLQDMNQYQEPKLKALTRKMVYKIMETHREDQFMH